MGQRIEISVPDIGDFDEVEVVEILVAKGDTVEFDDPIVSIESDKATMEIPAPMAGVIAEMRVQEGDRVSEGSVLAVLEVVAVEEVAAAPSVAEPPEAGKASVAARAAEPPRETGEEAPSSDSAAPPATNRAERPLSPAAANPIPDREGLPHASPLVRRYARELGVPLEQSPGTGPHGRILAEDLKEVVRERFAEQPTHHSSGNTPGDTPGRLIPEFPAIDFSVFGPVHEEKLTRIQKVSGPSLQRSWLSVPHVTQHDEADVTALESFRRERKAAAEERGLKLSPLLFVMKAVATTLREFPAFRSSLSPEADRLIVKDFFHLGIAVDTDQGLVVPVIRDVDRKGIFELAAEVNETAERARNRKLGPDDLRGAVFTISSLGGIGGTAFTPIVNAPEVAILGLSKTRVQPVWQGPLDGGSEARGEGGEGVGSFVPRQLMPLSLSYDHRVIDGAQAVRFTTRLGAILSDPLLLLL